MSPLHKDFCNVAYVPRYNVYIGFTCLLHDNVNVVYMKIIMTDWRLIRGEHRVFNELTVFYRQAMKDPQSWGFTFSFTRYMKWTLWTKEESLNGFFALVAHCRCELYTHNRETDDRATASTRRWHPTRIDYSTRASRW